VTLQMMTFLILPFRMSSLKSGYWNALLPSLQVSMTGSEATRFVAFIPQLVSHVEFDNAFCQPPLWLEPWCLAEHRDSPRVSGSWRFRRIAIHAFSLGHDRLRCLKGISAPTRVLIRREILPACQSPTSSHQQLARRLPDLIETNKRRQGCASHLLQTPDLDPTEAD
jgi:hypothetical protein